MATALRLRAAPALRTSFKIPLAQSFQLQSTKCMSTSKTQTLKEVFAAKVPAEIEKVKKLRKYAISKLTLSFTQSVLFTELTWYAETMAPKLWVRSLLTKSMAVLEASNPLSGKDLY